MGVFLKTNSSAPMTLEKWDMSSYSKLGSSEGQKAVSSGGMFIVVGSSSKANTTDIDSLCANIEITCTCRCTCTWRWNADQYVN